MHVHNYTGIWEHTHNIIIIYYEIFIIMSQKRQHFVTHFLLKFDFLAGIHRYDQSA